MCVGGAVLGAIGAITRVRKIIRSLPWAITDLPLPPVVFENHRAFLNLRV